MNKHDLFFELDAYDPEWQLKFDTIADAAWHADVEELYAEWLQTEEGEDYLNKMVGVPDTMRQNAAERALRENALAISAPMRYDGEEGFEIDDNDEEDNEPYDETDPCD